MPLCTPSEWYFSIIDIIEVLTGSSNPRRYWSDLKIQIANNEGFDQLYEKIVHLKLMATDGKMRETFDTKRPISRRLAWLHRESFFLTQDVEPA